MAMTLISALFLPNCRCPSSTYWCVGALNELSQQSEFMFKMNKKKKQKDMEKARKDMQRRIKENKEMLERQKQVREAEEAAERQKADEERAAYLRLLKKQEAEMQAEQAEKKDKIQRDKEVLEHQRRIREVEDPLFSFAEWPDRDAARGKDYAF